METMQTLQSRKSVRAYTGEMITEDTRKKILKAASASPVGMKKYDIMHLTVIENKELLQSMDAKTAEMFGNPDMHPLYGAPMLILVSVKPEQEKPNNAEYSDAAIMVHNMAIAAVDCGVGCCHIWGAVAALNMHPELLEKLDLPDGFVPCCGIVLGVTEEEYTVREIPERVKVNYIR